MRREIFCKYPKEIGIETSARLLFSKQNVNTLRDENIGNIETRHSKISNEIAFDFVFDVNVYFVQ